MGKRQVSSSSQSPPIPKTPKSKVQASKEKFDVRISKKESKPYSSNQATFVVCHKVKHLFHEYSLKLYSEKFLNKHIESEYYVNNTFEVELRAKFLKPFSNHKLLKFIGMNKKYNPNHVKNFYCNLEQTLDVYYYLEKSGRQLYDDQIMVQMKDPSDEADASGTGLLSINARAYFD